MDTRLRGRSLILARVAWVVLATLAISFFIANVPAHLRQLTTVSNEPQTWLQVSPAQERNLLSLGLSVRFYAVYLLALQIIVVAGFFGVSLLIFWRRSDDWMAIFVSLVSILYGTTGVPIGQALAQTAPAWRLPSNLLYSIGWGSGLLLFYLFPNGRFVPRWTRWLAVVVTAWILAWLCFPALNPDQWAFPLPFLTKTAWYGTSVFAQLYRYSRHSMQIERQQTKWVVFGFTAAFMGFFLFNLPVALVPVLQERTAYRLLYLLIAYPVVALFPMLLTPLSLGFACLRYRLWDIDLIIKRTLIYSALTAALALVYWGSVVVLQWLFRQVTGQAQSDIVTAVSTLAIAVAFQPVRRRIQVLIDRSFFRRKYDAEETLAAFNAAMRNDVQTDLNRLTDDLLAVVDKTMHPAHISLWLSPSVRGGRRPAHNG